MKPCLQMVPGGAEWVHVERSKYERLIKYEKIIAEGYPHCDCFTKLQFRAHVGDCAYAKGMLEQARKQQAEQQAQYDKEAKEQAQALYQEESQGSNGHKDLKGESK